MLSKYEEEHNNILSNIKAAFYIANFEITKFFYVSPSFEEIWGIPCEYLYKNPMSSIEKIIEEDRHLFHSHIDKEKLDNINYRIISDNGVIKWINDYRYKLPDKNGRDIKLIGMIQDVTEKKIAENENTLKNLLYQEIIDLIPHYIFARDENQNFIFANKLSAGSYGKDRNSIVGVNLRELHPDKIELESMLDVDRQIIEKDEGIHIPEIELTNFINGGKSFFSLTKIPFNIPGTDKKAILGFSINIDVNKQKEKVISDSYNLFYSMINLASDAIFLVDIEGNIKIVNDFSCRLLGYTKESLMRLKYSDLVFNYRDMTPLKITDLFEYSSYCVDKKEYNYLKNDGSYIIAETTHNVIYLEDKQYLICIARDISERKKTENDLRQSKLIVTQSQQIANIGNWVLDEETHALWWSDETFRMFGYEPLDFVPTMDFFINRVHPEDRAFLSEAILSAWKTRNSFSVEHRIIMPDGEERFVHEIGEMVYDDYGNPEKWIGAIQNITKRKIVEEVLRASEELHRSIFKASPDSIAVTDINGFIVKVSPSAVNMLGYEREEQLQGLSLLDFLVTEDIDRAKSNIMLKLQGIFTGSNEYKAVRVDGSIINIETNSEAMRDLDGQPTGMVFIVHDISNRKRSEELLKKSEETHRTIIETAIDGFCIINSEGRLLEANESLGEIYGYSIQDILTMNISDFETIETDHKITNKRLVITKKGAELFETRHRRKDGSIFDVEIGIKYLPIDTGNFVVFVKDISKRKKTENELRESKSILTQSQQIAQIGNWVLNDSTHELWWSDETFRIMGYKPQEFIPTMDLFIQCVHPEDRTFLNDAIVYAWENRTKLSIEHRIIQPDGNVHFVLEVGEIFYNDAGKPDKWVGAVQNITERKNNEEEFLKANILLKSIVENIPDTIFLKDAKELRFVLLNRAGEDLTGYSHFDLKGKNDYDFVPKTQADFFTENDRAVLNGKVVKDIPEELLQTRYKGERILHTKKVPILDNLGNPEFLLGISEDITGQKLAEMALRRSEEKYHNLVQNTNSIIIQWDNQGRITFINEYAQKFFGYSEEEILGHNAIGTIIPEKESSGRDLNILISDILENPEFHNTNTNENINKSHQRFWITWTNRPIYDEYGKLQEILSVGIDITAQKKAEEALKKMRHENEQFLRHEMQNNIIPIKSYIELLLMDKNKLSMENVDYLNKIKESVDDSISFLNHFKNIFNIENGLYNLKLSKNSFNEIIEDVIKLFHVKCIKPSIIIDFNYNKNPVISMIDKELLKNVFLNLINNAIEHVINCRRKTDRKITINLIEDNELAIIKINNKGKAVHPNLLNIFFEKFVTTKNNQCGSGLGTSYSKVVVNAHGGNISVDSNKKEGTTVKIELKTCQ